MKLGPERAALILQDDFYFDQSKNFDFDGGSVNFDHPSSLDFDLLAACLLELKAGRLAEIPIYDFVTHSRSQRTKRVEPCDVIIVDGILIAHAAQVRSICDWILFFDTPEDLRFQRRLDRDVRERGRTPEGVRQQFERQVKPMHDQFVEPSKKWASQIVHDGESFEGALQKISELTGLS